jgi:transcriptional regulator with XRE-family HTH domain
MSRPLVERRLIQVGDRLKELRADLGVTEEQLEQLQGEADDARLRSLVSETPLAEREHRDAQRHADALARHAEEVRRSIAELERRQDELLDELAAGR